MHFFCNKHAILLFAVWLSVGLVSVGYAHDGDEHTRDIGLVFGFFLKKGVPRKPHGSELREDVGKIIADLIDNGAKDFHRSVNEKIGNICCESDYSSLYIKRYNQQVSDLRERIKEIPLDLLEESNRRKEVIQDLRSISEEMQSFYFDQDCSARAFNVELTLNEFEKHLDYKHDVSFDKVKSAFQDLKDALDRVPEMPQLFQNEVQKKIMELASDDRLFNWGDYGHRLYFHWGMDVNIHSFKQLEDCIDRSCKDLEEVFFPRSGARRRGDTPLRTAEDDDKIQKLQGRLRDTIYNLIENEWEKRKQKALDDLRTCLGKYNNDKLKLIPAQYEMLLKLAYYVHILGDYETPNKSALIDVKEIKEAFNDILKEALWGSKEGNRDITKLTNELLSRNTAKDMLDFLKTNIPVLIEHSPDISNALW